MGKLWEPNEKYNPSEVPWWGNLPYKRLYKNLTQEELGKLLRDAMRLGWKGLDLEKCGLDSLPDALWELKELQFLTLGNTTLGSIEGDRNTYEELPSEIGRLSNLRRLDLYRSQIRALPDSFGLLSNLQWLNLSGAQICELPDSIGRLSNLQTLDLRSTQIRKLPDSIGQLPNLKSLNLSHCHLKEIPYSLVKLGLPFETDKSIKDHCINLTDVTLDEGDITLFSQPREVIEEYYRNKQEARPIRECKVIFLGDGEGGKSSLIDRMVNNHFEAGSLPTDGVKMTKWTLPVNGEDYTLRILDFGGQEIMHSMHRCFLTAHTVYVVVCASREDTDIDDAAARWLETVKSFAPDCPVILALNKADLNPNVSVNERNLRERNPNLKDVLKTSAKWAADDSRFGVNRLREVIRAQIPGAVHTYQANPDIIALKTALENMDADTISADDYRKLCERNHITDGKLQYFLLGFFRDLGVAYFYESKAMDTRLESVRVLNPAWLTNGIYRLILRTEESGFLSHKAIQETLGMEFPGDISKTTYTREETEYILHVMRFFQISLAMRDEQGRETGVELIPLKLPKTPPKIREGSGEVFADEFPRADALHLRWEGTYLPINLIHRLMIRKFPELDTRRLWRTGGQFRQRGGDCAAMAVMDENALDVYVTGARDCRPYLNSFRVEIQEILNGLNLKPREVIFVTAGGQTGSVPYEHVLKQYYDKRDEIFIDGLSTYPNPAAILRDTYYHWEQEAARYGERAGRPDRFPADMPDSPPPPKEEKPAPLDDEVKKAEIALKTAQAREAELEIKLKRLKITLAVGLALLVPALIALLPDLRDKLLEWFFGLLGKL